jgi:hypothetical protein
MQGDRRSAKTRVARVTRRGTAISPRHVEPEGGTRSRERGRAAEDGSAPVSRTDADEVEPVGPPPVGRGTFPTT